MNICFGELAGTSNVCSRRGHCVAPNKCECTILPHVLGDACEMGPAFAFFVIALITATVGGLIVILPVFAFCIRYFVLVYKQKKNEQSMQHLLSQGLLNNGEELVSIIFLLTF